MIQYHGVNVILSNSSLNELKSVTKNATNVTPRLSLNMISTDETNYPHNLLFTDRKVSSLCKAFANKSLVNV